MPMRFAQLGRCVRRRRQRIRGLRAGRPGRMTFHPARAFPRCRPIVRCGAIAARFQRRIISPARKRNEISRALLAKSPRRRFGKGTTSVVPPKCYKRRGFSRCGSLFSTTMRRQREPPTPGLKRDPSPDSGGTTKVVPFPESSHIALNTSFVVKLRSSTKRIEYTVIATVSGSR
jgi:hypothetical protein